MFKGSLRGGGALTMGLTQGSSVVGCGASVCGMSMLGEHAPRGQGTVMLGSLFGVFLAAWRTEE